MTKRILSLFLAFMLLGSISITAFAYDVPDVTREDCSIEIVVRYDGEAVSGGELTCIRVGDVYKNDEGYSFCRVLDGKELDDVQSETLAEELAQFVVDNEEKFNFESLTLTVGEDGKAKFEGCKTGLYVIVQDTPAEGFSALKPFLVSLPYMEDGEYQYHVSAATKSELVREPKFADAQSITPPNPSNPTQPTNPTNPTKPTNPTLPKPSEKLPYTGQLNWPVPVLAMSGVLLFAIGWVLRFRRRKENYEK